MPQLTIDWDDPSVDRDRAMTLSGLDWMQAMVDGTIVGPPIGPLMGMQLVEAGPGTCTFTLTPGPQHTNPMGGVHGGTLATLLDSVTGCAVHTRLDVGVGYGTTDLHVRMLRAPKVGVEVTATGRAVHVGRTTATADGEARDADGRLLATATAGFVILRG